ncbi:MAG: PGF-pre-PGF domain-containing protein [Candidatus Methanoperedens sp.]|nr:PGF-pre-PGF domain-containing protein [Candidatus Methanoperedens sp.]MCZ7370637.1 PGF-pre-PGF domain-containing protein [Candidatus Methanoperedens sp.]
MKVQVLIAFILFGSFAASAAGTATITFDKSITVPAKDFNWQNSTFTVTNVGNYKLNDPITVTITSGEAGMRVILYNADRLSEWSNPVDIPGGQISLTIPSNTVSASGIYGIVISSQGYVIGANPVIISEYDLTVTPDRTQATAGSTIKVTVQVAKNGIPVNIAPNNIIKVEFVLGSTSTYSGGNAMATATGTYEANVQIPTSGDYRLFAAITTNQNISGYPELIGAGDGGAIKITALSSGGGISGGGGGGSGSSGEEFKNIESSEAYEKYISKDVPISYVFRQSSNPVSEIVITGNNNAGDTTVKTEILRGTSTLVKSPAPGTTYKNINIQVGTSGFANPKNIKAGIIKFKVENSWLGDNSLAGSDIKLVRWDGSMWADLETTETNKNGTYTYFEAKTQSFSSFAIIGVKSQAATTETAQPVPTATAFTPEATETGTTQKVTPGFETALFSIALLIASFLRDRIIK